MFGVMGHEMEGGREPWVKEGRRKGFWKWLMSSLGKLTFQFQERGLTKKSNFTKKKWCAQLETHQDPYLLLLALSRPNCKQYPSQCFSSTSPPLSSLLPSSTSPRPLPPFPRMPFSPNSPSLQNAPAPPPPSRSRP